MSSDKAGASQKVDGTDAADVESRMNVLSPEEKAIVEAEAKMDSSGAALKMNMVQLVSQSSGWSGPLPPPEVLAAYDRIVPGMAKSILDEYVADSKYQRSAFAAALEDSRSRSALTSKGAIVSFCISAAGSVAGLYFNQTTVAVLFAVTAMFIAGGSNLLSWIADHLLPKPKPPSEQ